MPLCQLEQSHLAHRSQREAERVPPGRRDRAAGHRGSRRTVAVSQRRYGRARGLLGRQDREVQLGLSGAVECPLSVPFGGLGAPGLPSRTAELLGKSLPSLSAATVTNRAGYFFGPAALARGNAFCTLKLFLNRTKQMPADDQRRAFAFWRRVAG
jgi:hypothetical protein